MISPAETGAAVLVGAGACVGRGVAVAVAWGADVAAAVGAAVAAEVAPGVAPALVAVGAAVGAAVGGTAVAAGLPQATTNRAKTNDNGKRDFNGNFRIYPSPC